MAERYTRVFSLSENLYTSGAPIVIAAGALLKDNQTGKTLAQLKFKNLSEKNIKALKVSIAAFDVSGNALTGIDEYQYLDLAVERNETFGQKQAIYLPNAVTRSITVKCKEVIFEDGTVWKAADGVNWAAIPKQETLAEHLGSLAAQYCRDTSDLSKFVLLEHENLWLCTCGAINHSEETACHRCNYEKVELQEAMELEGLRQRNADYEKEITEKAEIRAREKTAEAEKNRLRRARITKMSIISATLVLLIVTAFMLITRVIIPNRQYNNALAIMEAGQYTEAISMFEALEGYKDSTTKINECNMAILDDKYNDAIVLLDAGQYTEAISMFEALEGYKDSTTKINECNTAILDDKYNDAIVLLDAGNIVEAYEALVALDGYKDSTAKANSIYDTYLLKTATKGDYLCFGAYEQDNNLSNGKEDIEWLVLKTVNSKALLISKYALDCVPYDTSNADVTWATCSLRSWLNNDFFNTAFSDEEQSAILSTYTAPGGATTKDKVFLLNQDEAGTYIWISGLDMTCRPTDYAVANGVDAIQGNGLCLWWLRSYNKGKVDIADYNSIWIEVELDWCYDAAEGNPGVRPALWIDLNGLS